MAKKNKSTTLDFYYLNNNDNNKKKNKNNKSKKVTSNKKVGRKPTSTSKRKGQAKSNTINLDDEIIIGVTKIQDNKPKKNKQKGVKKSKNKSNKERNIKQKKERKQEKNNQRLRTQLEKNNNKAYRTKIIKLVLKIFLLLAAIITTVILLLTSSIFNIYNIEIEGNSIIKEDTVISLSNISIDQNIFSISKKQVRNNIKQNAYVESVKITRKLPNKIEITIDERKPTFILEYINSFVYLNNQGYILEISKEKLDLPIIIGISTSEEDIYEGNRLNIEDLEKLDTTIKIIETYKNNEIDSSIDKIDISNKINYKLILESGKKTVYLGDASNINNRILYLKSILQAEKGKTGEVFINGDMNSNTNKVFFRDNTK